MSQEKSSQLENKNKIPGFGERFKIAFGNATHQQIADALGLKSKSAITNYVQDRVPEPETLLMIAKHTGFSLHWLLTGEGPKSTGDMQESGASISRHKEFHLHVRFFEIHRRWSALPDPDSKEWALESFEAIMADARSSGSSHNERKRKRHA